MKKLKLFSVILAGIIATSFMSIGASTIWNVINSNQNFVVNGQSVKLNALNINGSNYLKVAEIAKLLNAEVSYDEKTDTVYINNEIFNTNSMSNINSMVLDSIDVKKIEPLEYISLGTYELKTGDIIHYNLVSGGKGNLSIGFVKLGDDPEKTQNRYFTTLNSESNVTKVSSNAVTRDQEGKYTLYISNISDQVLLNITGTVTIENPR